MTPLWRTRLPASSSRVLPAGPSSEMQHDSKSGKRRPAPALWPCAQMARRPNDSARGGDEPRDYPSLWPGRASPAPLPPFLVPVVWSRHGHGLALLGYHHQRHWGAETRSDCAPPVLATAASARWPWWQKSYTELPIASA